jgi:hypothetical protein
VARELLPSSSMSRKAFVRGAVLSVWLGACGAFSSSSPSPAPPDVLDAAASPDAAPGPDGASVPDAALSDGASTDGGACEALKGTATPCSSCVGDQYVVPGVPFGLTSAGGSFFYITLEGDAGDNPRNGEGVGAVHRRPLPSGVPPRVLAQGLSSPSHLAVSGGTLFVAQRGRGAAGPRLSTMPADCNTASACTPQLLTTLPNDPWDMAPTSSGVAVLGDGVVTFVHGAAFASVSLPLGPYRGIAAHGGRVLVGGITFAELVLFGDEGNELGRYKLPERAGAAGVEGAVALAMTCDRAAVLRTANDGTDKLSWLDLTTGVFTDPISVERKVFALRMDATHTYVGKPDAGGVWRYDNGDTFKLPSPIVTGVDVWRLAIDDEALFYDKHGSQGIVRMPKAKP